MKKVAIITMCGNYNYGNKLQNYALQYSLQKRNCKVYSIWNKDYKPFSKQSINCFIQHIKNCINYVLRRNYHQIKNSYFIGFNKRFLNYYHKKVYNSECDFLKGKFDKIFIGSDQIWKYFARGDKFGYLEFGLFEDQNKVFSYAPSFGISKIPSNQIVVYKKGLEHLNMISVREQSGVELVKSLSGRDAVWVLDPTMLLNEQEWNCIAKKPEFISDNDDYILVYFLGNSVQINPIRMLAKERNLKIICINPGTFEFYHSGPCEFVYLIKNAKMILTDSFHACTFSIIYNKPFYVFERKDSEESMISRIDSLLTRYSLIHRKIDSIEDILFDDFSLDDNTINMLKIDMKKSNDFIDECLNRE